DLSATIVVSTVTGEDSVAVDSNDGSWSFPFTLQAGPNVINIIASDQRGNLNQLTLNLLYEPSIPN
ncbi:MAG: hypothetical protein U1D97_12250, partial [Desulfuromonadales bacterium]|nr:hypothetical protein [Desulfuromonadales bacterium]